MRVDANTNLNSLASQGSLKVNAGLANLYQGDKISAKALFLDGNTVHLKTDEGALIKATLNEGVNLIAGERVNLVVTDRNDTTILLAVDKEPGRSQQTSSDRPWLQGDAALQELASALESRGYPVTKETVLLLRSIMEANPGISLDKAVFLAANKIPQTPELVQSTANLLDGNLKTGEMLSQLIALLDSSPETVTQGGFQLKESWFAAFDKAASNLVQEGQDSLAQTDFNQLVKVLLGGKAESANPPLKGEIAAPAEQSSPPVQGQEKPVLNFNENVLPRGSGLSKLIANSSPAAFEPLDSAALPKEFQVKLSPPLVVDEGVKIAQNPEIPGRASLNQGQEVKAFSENEILSLLSKMPSLSASAENVSPQALERFSAVMEASVQEFRLADSLQNELSQGAAVKTFLEGLFASLSSERQELGSVLQKAAQELELRLIFLKEAIEISELGNKGELLGQTQKLLQHLRVINNIDQFTYLQIPIQLGEQRQTAELFVYKRKNSSKKVDPEDVKILLNLDLQYMGHLESFIQVKGKEIALQMEVKNEDLTAFIKSNTLSLYKSLQDLGYKLTDVKVQAFQKEETTLKDGMLALLEYEKRNSAGVDFTV